ncbi:MAG: hypothetical protein ACFFDN_45770 [Candidatus Hodarchaeota archaeon]
MAYYQNRWKRFMEIVLSQIPSLLIHYSPLEQKFLNEFLNVFQNYEVNTQNKRQTLLNHFDRYTKEYLPQKIYFDTPFLWFTVSFLENASQLLSIPEFYLNRFYKYFKQNLRKFFNFVKERVPLNDVKWEKLQYECNKLSMPLSYEELRVLELTYIHVFEAGRNALYFDRLKQYINTQMMITKNSRFLENLFIRLNAKWYPQFSSSFFGLEQLYFHLQLSESVTLLDIIDFQNKANTTLCASRIYQIRNFPRMYTGILIIPSKNIQNLIEYLQQKERQGEIFLHYISKISDSRITGSLASYEAEKGWQTLSTNKLQNLKKQLSSTTYRGGSTPRPLFLTKPFNQSWSCFNHPQTEQIINLYLDLPFFFSSKDLLRKAGCRNQIPHLNLLKDLFEKQVVFLSFFPSRMINSFSLYKYWLNIPLIPFKQLLRLLYYLPSAHVFFTEDNIQIWTRLDHELQQWFKNDLKWSVHQILRLRNPNPLLKAFFDKNDQTWRTPLILS